MKRSKRKPCFLRKQSTPNFLKNKHFLPPYAIEQTVGNKAKGQISKLIFQDNKARQIFQKTGIYFPLIRITWCVSGGKKCPFFGKLDVICFLETPILKFALLSYYRRFVAIYLFKAFYHRCLTNPKYTFDNACTKFMH